MSDLYLVFFIIIIGAFTGGYLCGRYTYWESGRDAEGRNEGAEELSDLNTLEEYSIFPSEAEAADYPEAEDEEEAKKRKGEPTSFFS